MPITTVAFTALLGAQPQPVLAPDLASQIDRTVSIDTGVIAYDESGEIVATIETWEDSGDLVIVAGFPDGFAQYTMDLETHAIDVAGDLDTATVTERLTAMGHTLEIGHSPASERGLVGCGVAVLATAIATATANAPGATLGGIAAVCACTPLILPKAAKCPHW